MKLIVHPRHLTGVIATTAGNETEAAVNTKRMRLQSQAGSYPRCYPLDTARGETGYP